MDAFLIPAASAAAGDKTTGRLMTSSARCHEETCWERLHLPGSTAAWACSTGSAETNRKEPDRLEDSARGKVADRPAPAEIAPKCRISRARVGSQARYRLGGGSASGMEVGLPSAAPRGYARTSSRMWRASWNIATPSALRDDIEYDDGWCVMLGHARPTKIGCHCGA